MGLIRLMGYVGSFHWKPRSEFLAKSNTRSWSEPPFHLYRSRISKDAEFLIFSWVFARHASAPDTHRRFFLTKPLILNKRLYTSARAQRRICNMASREELL